ncbi:response regulator transcription factor [Flammeovirgaceae bacterium SG7u.111]|nr:response regulator transcription factor [Flammeovirgaceae bacterium SG7u.132]WPO34708.1 response regulator transcription factor [Flammeovirgaceae bacterium SG7u.111]
MTKAKLLLVEDDPSLGFVVKDNLERENFEVKLATDGQKAVDYFRAIPFDLCLLDIMLPKKDGFSVAEEMKAEQPKFPIVFLTARNMKEDKIRGFKTGCDDYVTKPFSIEELVLRVEAVLNRCLPNGNSTPILKQFNLGNYLFDSKNQVLALGKETKGLTKRESDLLVMLAHNQGELVPKGEILEKLWGKNDYFNGRSLDVFVSKLRKYLSQDEKISIENVHSSGFRLVVTR